jgi:hypothetical protein
MSKAVTVIRKVRGSDAGFSIGIAVILIKLILRLEGSWRTEIQQAREYPG